MLDSVFVGITASYKFEGGNASREVVVVDLDREQAGYFCSKEKMELMVIAANAHRPYSATLKHDKQGFYVLEEYEKGHVKIKTRCYVVEIPSDKLMEMGSCIGSGKIPVVETMRSSIPEGNSSIG